MSVQQIARFRPPNKAGFERECGVYACTLERWVTFEAGGGEGTYCGVTTVGLCRDHASQALRSLMEMLR